MGISRGIVYVLLPAWIGAGIGPARAQYMQQGQKLVGTPGGSAGLGWSVALSSDGNTAVVGAPFDNYSLDAGGGTGAVWVYTRSHGVWSHQGSKLAIGAGVSSQGSSVALSADGNTAIVGGDSDSGGAGAVWVFTRSAGVWTQQGPKLVSTQPSANLGYSVAVSADGNTLIAGGPGERNNTGVGPGNGNNVGGAWVFTRDSSGVWRQQGNELLGNDAVGAAGQGRSVALSGDGNTALVGGDWDNLNLGAVWVYTRTGGVWTQQGHKLIGTGSSSNNSSVNEGFSVALSSDGNTAAVGGNNDSGGAGALWIFTRTAGVWTQQGQKLVGTGADDPYGSGNTAAMGSSVALSGDGNTAIAGGPDEVNGLGTGAAWVFRRGANGVWSQQGSKLVGSGSAPNNTNSLVEGPREGFSVALSANATTAMIGGWDDSNLDGAAWAFALPSFSFSAPTAASGGTPFNFKVSALDPNNLPLPTYAGTVHFTSTDGAAALPADSALTAGVGNFSATLNTGGNQTITASDTANSAVTGTSSAITVTGAVPLVPPSPVSVTPAGGNAANPTFTLVYADPRGYQDLHVVDILVNNFLNGRHACYLAYIVAQNTLILVDDGGDAGGPYAGNVALGNSNPIHNSQCSVTLVSAVGSGNNLTLMLTIAWTASFAGDKIVQMAAGDVAGNNSGWQPLGVARVPGGTPTTTTAVVSISPNRGNGLGPTPFAFTYSDTLGSADLGVEDILINSSLNGQHACYIAYSRPFHTLYLVDDNGDALLPGQDVASSGSASNSQCTVSWSANAVNPSGNNLALTFNITFAAAFGGNRVIYVAARDVNEANSTDWHAMGTWTPQ